ncbi:hypothetical protein GGR25_002283 [Kaistia hirudinis]|uniref:DNA transfer protein n=1 Tax=Kaistia hirudinis TaxID=1293440 RepID=A0A840APN2_9HYPH|nr:hypothetical protein [Kaistia hirudinis]MBB3931233.1 hypothetical protein [Kaistia hirudinis]
MVAVATIGSAVIGAGASALASSKAAKAQTQAADKATQYAQQAAGQASQWYTNARDVGNQALQDFTGQAIDTQNAALPQLLGYYAGAYGNGQSQMAPYIGLGQSAAGAINDLYANPQNAQAWLAATPGYQFTLNQGLKAVQNSAAARGLGSSGAALKGAANYATGLADNTYQNQFGNLTSLLGTGQNAAGLLSNLGLQTASGAAGVQGQTAANVANMLTALGAGISGNYMNAAQGVGNALIGAGNTSGQAAYGAGNAQAGAALNTAQGITNAANNIAQYELMKTYLQPPQAMQTGGLY